MRKSTMKNRGNILITTLVFGAIATYLLAAITNWAVLNMKVSRLTVNREQALEIAEAGTDYYRWHLAHNSTDYKDGSTSPTGPYVHQYYDKDGNLLGTYSLTITPPITGSTLITIQSTGKVNNDNSSARTIITKLAIPSLAQYAVVANDDMRFGAGTEVFGPISSNGGIQFDGIAHNIVSSAKSTYTDPDTGNLSYGVHTLTSPADPAPPGTLTSHADVFMAGRSFPIAAVDFAGITTSLAQIKTDASTSTGRYFANSGGLGYHIILKTNDTFDLYKVNTMASASGGCSNSLSQTGWGTWSIKSGGSGETFIANYAFPANGLIFVEDNLWVEGQINSARLTIAAGTFPDNVNTRKSITVNNNLLYTNFDGTDSIALIAQNNINVGMVSADTLTIDGALMAQNGRAGRYYYSSSCFPYDSRTTLNLYGMIGSNQRYGFAYSDNTGYNTRNITYDGNLLYAPPPSFPLSSSQYQTISWKELK